LSVADTELARPSLNNTKGAAMSAKNPLGDCVYTYERYPGDPELGTSVVIKVHLDTGGRKVNAHGGEGFPGSSVHHFAKTLPPSEPLRLEA